MWSSSVAMCCSSAANRFGPFLPFGPGGFLLLIGELAAFSLTNGGQRPFNASRACRRRRSGRPLDYSLKANLFLVWRRVCPSFSPLQKLLKRSGVGDAVSVLEFEHFCYQTAEKIAVVRHNDKSPCILQQGFFHNVFGPDIEMIGGLIKNEQVRGLQQHFCQCEAALFTAAEHGNSLFNRIPRKEKGP